MAADKTPAAHAVAAAEAVRALNHATIFGGYSYPSDVYDVLGGLGQMLSGLAQALRQGERWISAEHMAGRVGDDRGGNPSAAVAALADLLDEACRAADNVYRLVDIAAGVAAHLTTPSDLAGGGR